MATEITMPKLSDTMEEGKLVSWKKGVGDQIVRGDIIAEVETDKAVMELESFSSGVLLEVRVKTGEMVKVGTTIALVGMPEERERSQPQPQESLALEPPEQAPFASAQEPQTKIEPSAERELAPPEVKGTGGESKTATIERAAPAVRRYAREQGVDLAKVRGTGPEGRILHADVEQALFEAQRVAKPAEAKPVEAKPAEAKPAEPEGPTKAEHADRASKMRSAIAKVVSDSWRSIPHFNVTIEVDMAMAEQVRKDLKEGGTKISINDMVVKASAMALEKFPLLNSSFAEQKVVSHDSINVGIAVSLPDGLMIPVVRNCERLGLAQVAQESARLVEKARSGKISEQEITGGTFSVSNLGMFGVDEFMAIIMPPQGGILAVGTVADRPVAKGGMVVVGRRMKLTLSADHRLLDGAYAANFLAEVKAILEAPVRMLI